MTTELHIKSNPMDHAGELAYVMEKWMQYGKPLAINAYNESRMD